MGKNWVGVLCAILAGCAGGLFLWGANWPNKRGAILAGSALAGGVFSDFLGRNRHTRGTRCKRPGFCKSGVSGRNEKGELFFGFISATIK